MIDQTLLVSDASTGLRLAELPWSNMQRSRLLSGAGQLTCSLPTAHPAVTRSNCGQLRASPDRVVTHYRDGVAVWSGFISGTECTFSDGVLNLTAREFPWIFSKRVLEVDKDFNGMDVFDIVRWLVDYMTTKTATGDDGSLPAGSDIVAALPRFAISPASADAGATYTFSRTPTVYGTDRKTIQEIIDLLSKDPETGFEYRTSCAGSTWLSYQHTVEFGYPSVGATLTREVTPWIASDYGRSIDGEQAGTRTHVMSAQGPVVKQSASMVANGAMLLENVEDLSDGTIEMAKAHATEIRRLSRPPGPRVPTFSYIPDDVLPYGFCDIGDTWPFQITTPEVLMLTADTRRVVEEDVTCDVDGSEEITLVFNEPLTDLGA